MRGDEQVRFAQEPSRAEAIARLNDRLRKGAFGGQVIVTKGVRNLPGYHPLELLRALSDYDSFNPDNDPYAERDFGDLTVFGTDLFWKIEYYDLKLECGSPDPVDPRVTFRMLKSEY